MSEEKGFEKFSKPAQEEPDVVGLIKGLAQQLIYLERKIDQLLNQSQQRPASSGFNRDNRERDRGTGESRYSSPKRSYGEDRGGSRGERPYKRKFEDKKRGFDPKKKSFYHKRDDR